MRPGLSGALGACATLSQNPSFGGLDKVGVGICGGLLREIPGIKIGHARAGQII